MHVHACVHTYETHTHTHVHTYGTHTHTDIHTHRYRHTNIYVATKIRPETFKLLEKTTRYR